MPDLGIFGALGAYGVSLAILLLWIKDKNERIREIRVDRNFWRDIALTGQQISSTAIAEIEKQRQKRRGEFPSDSPGGITDG